MDFAKNLLMKYGWREGCGIGKNEDGITEPVKANLKFDNTGLDYDRAQEFTNHWWERAYNIAAENLNVQNSSKNVSLSMKNSEEISTTGMFQKNMKGGSEHEKYLGHFRKSNKSDDQVLVVWNDIHSNVNKALTDEDVLSACGGRTAHKGARLGLSLSGKLSRIEAQEQQLLQKMSMNTDTSPSLFKDWIQVKKKSLKLDKRKSNNLHLSTNKFNVDVDDMLNCEYYKIKPKSKKKKKQQRNRDEDLSKRLAGLNTNITNDPGSKLCGIQDISKTIKKYNTSKSKNQIDVQSNGSKKKKSIREIKKFKKNSIKGSSRNSDDQHECETEDPLVEHINNVISKHSNKKFKLVLKEMTPLEKKHLKKSGLKMDMKSTKYDKKKEKRERAQVKKITKKLMQSINIGC